MVMGLVQSHTTRARQSRHSSLRSVPPPSPAAAWKAGGWICLLALIQVLALQEASGLGLSEPGHPSSQHLEGRSPSETPNFCDLTCLILRKLPEGVVQRTGFLAFLPESDSGAMGVEFGLEILRVKQMGNLLLRGVRVPSAGHEEEALPGSGPFLLGEVVLALWWKRALHTVT